MNTQEFIAALYAAGWTSPNDAQHKRITAWFQTARLNTAFKPDWSELEACRDSLREHMALCSRFKDLLRQIAYPEGIMLSGEFEPDMDIYEAQKLIRSNFSPEELDDK